WGCPRQNTGRLTVDVKNYTQPVTVKMDPRVRTPALGIQQQFTLAKQLYDDAAAAAKALAQVRAVRAQLAQLKGSASGNGEAIAAFDKKASAIEGSGGGGRGGGGRGAISEGPETLSSANATLGALIRLLESADVAPTTQ